MRSPVAAVAVFCFALFTLFSTGALAEPAQGKEYSLLAMPQDTNTGKKIEVVEFFYYGCPHCFDAEPSINAWLKKMPKDVEFRRIPGVFQDAWLPLTRLFYALDAMNLEGKLHSAVFNAIHVQKIDLSNEKTMADWIAKQGVNRQKFLDVYRSFAVQNKAQRATQLTSEYGIQGVPSIVVDGKYLTSGSMAGNFDDMFLTVDYLVAKARKERLSKH
ncbi:MAG: thiol:disulfide interchange protein DsbA/DsbL [Burkholderiales bacterium]